MVQNILAWGSGFVLACYFPYYFYKAFNLENLRFHARYGVLLFLLTPFLLFFGVEYLIEGNIDLAVKHGVIIPFVYAIICVIAMYKGIRKKQQDDPKLGREMYLSLIAIAPWVSMPILSFFHISQLPEVLIMNGGFLVITALFIWNTIKQTRADNQRLEDIRASYSNESVGNEAITPIQEDKFEHNCDRLRLSRREIEVAALMSEGLKYKEIGERLFISERTVTKHVQNMFMKAGVTNKVEFLRALRE